MAHRDVRLGLMLRDHIDGIPLDLAARLLPGRTRWNLGLGAHIHAHARAQAPVRGPGGRGGRRDEEGRPSARSSSAALLDSLRRTIRKLDWKPEGTEWADYAENTSYGEDAHGRQGRPRPALPRATPAATSSGTSGRTPAASAGSPRTSGGVSSPGTSIPPPTERHYRLIRRDGDESILPLVLDLANPSPGLGWAGEERRSLEARSNADVVLALALVHHLAIGRNVPLERIAGYFVEARPGPRHRVRSQGRPDGPQAPRHARGRLPGLHARWLPGSIRDVVRHRGGGAGHRDELASSCGCPGAAEPSG